MTMIATMLAAAVLNVTAQNEAARVQELPANGDVVQIGDFQYVLVNKEDWEKMWVMVCDLKGKIYKANESESGRQMFHGKRVHTTITNGMITVEYADGYTRTEKAKENAQSREGRPVPRRDKSRLPNAVKKARGADFTANMPEGLRKVIEKRDLAKTTTNEVSVTVNGGGK